MKSIELGKSGLLVPTIAIGCMRIKNMEQQDLERHIRTAMEHGANLFDHADVYGDGACESAFSRAIHMSPQIREKMILQTKCGIVSDVRYDLSKEYIIESVEKALKRLNTEYIDILLLHRPDALVEPEEVAQAWDNLKQRGLVRYFGVSNHNRSQIELLSQAVGDSIVTNQLQLSIVNSHLIREGMFVNTPFDEAVNRDNGVFNYCRQNQITVQAWSPFMYGYFEGIFIGSKNYPQLNQKLEEIAEIHHVTPTTIAIAWLLRHPAKLLPVVGTTNTNRLLECLNSTEITLSRDEWYALYLAAGNTLL